MGARASYPAGTFCWVDLVTADVATVKRFYGDLLGWVTPEAEDYVRWTIGGRDIAGLRSVDGAEPHWTSYVAVDDADSLAARAAELGGIVIEPPFDIGDDGRRAVVADPTGAHFALCQPGGRPGAGLVNDVGCWCSNQLSTPDPAAAIAFYRDLLGWEIEPEGDSYWSVRNAGSDNGGILAAPGPASWLVYFHVEFADTAASSAEALGGSVLEPPQTIGLGRIAVVADPHGAAFGVFEGRTDP